jgi:hypothetical protein
LDEKILRAQPRNTDDAIVTQALLARAVTSAILIVYLTLKVFANELGESFYKMECVHSAAMSNIIIVRVLLCFIRRRKSHSS